MWTIVVETSEEATTKVYRRPITATIYDIAAVYAEDVGERQENIVLLSTEGRPLPPHTTLEAVGELVKGGKLVKLIPETGFQVWVEIYKGWEQRRTISVRPTSLPEALHPLVRGALYLGDEPMFRLRTAQSVLKYNLTLAEQGVAPGSVLLVDVAFQVEVEDLWDGEKTNHFVYSSETCGDLLGEDVSQLRCGSRTLDKSHEIADAFEGLPGTDVSLSRHCRRPMAVLDERSLRQRAVWPEDQLRQIERRCPDLSFEGERLPRGQAFAELDLPEHALLITRPVRLEVRLRSGRRVVVRVPRCATVADVRAAVRPNEKSDTFSLRRAQQLLDEEDADLQAVGAADGGPLELTPRAVAITVRLRERSVQWSSEGGPQRFGDLMGRVAAETDLPYANLLGRSLRCTGCGRRLCREEEDVQVVPVGCCRVRSLVLEEPPAPPAVADAETQTRCRGRGPTSHKTVSTQPVSTEDFAAQVAPLKRKFSTQHPPVFLPRPFLIRDYIRGQEVRCDLRLSDHPTVGEVTAAVAKAVKRRPKQVKLVQIVTKGAAAVLVCDSEGDLLNLNAPIAEYGDSTGCLSLRTLAGRNFRTLNDDSEPFILVPGRRNYIQAYNR